jgi:hypothetical protein
MRGALMSMSSFDIRCKIFDVSDARIALVRHEEKARVMPAAPKRGIHGATRESVVVRVRDCARISLFGSSLR